MSHPGLVSLNSRWLGKINVFCPARNCDDFLADTDNCDWRLLRALEIMNAVVNNNIPADTWYWAKGENPLYGQVNITAGYPGFGLT